MKGAQIGVRGSSGATQCVPPGVPLSVLWCHGSRAVCGVSQLQEPFWCCTQLVWAIGSEKPQSLAPFKLLAAVFEAMEYIAEVGLCL